MIFLGLGGNMPSEQFGPPRATLEAALAALKRHGIQVCRRSRWYHSRPVPDDGQPWYVNGVSEIATTLPPGELLARLLEIEREFGRERRKRWAPRTIDLDLLAYHELSNWAAGAAAAPVAAPPAPARARLRPRPARGARAGLAASGARPHGRGDAGSAPRGAICRTVGTRSWRLLGGAGCRSSARTLTIGDRLEVVTGAKGLWHVSRSRIASRKMPNRFELVMLGGAAGARRVGRRVAHRRARQRQEPGGRVARDRRGHGRSRSSALRADPWSAAPRRDRGSAGRRSADGLSGAAGRADARRCCSTRR